MLNRNTHTQNSESIYILNYIYILHIKSLPIIVHFIEHHSRVLHEALIYSSPASTISIIQM